VATIVDGERLDNPSGLPFSVHRRIHTSQAKHRNIHAERSQASRSFRLDPQFIYRIPKPTDVAYGACDTGNAGPNGGLPAYWSRPPT
jgi:hypothetical protein